MRAAWTPPSPSRLSRQSNETKGLILPSSFPTHSHWGNGFQDLFVKLILHKKKIIQTRSLPRILLLKNSFFKKRANSFGFKRTQPSSSIFSPGAHSYAVQRTPDGRNNPSPHYFWFHPVPVPKLGRTTFIWNSSTFSKYWVANVMCDNKSYLHMFVKELL